jgi:hypothetical protein
MKTLGLSLCVLALSACFSVRHGYRGEKFLTAAPEVPGVKTVKLRHFALQDRQLFLIHGAVPLGSPLNGAALAAREVGEHAGVVNLRIREGQDVMDVAVSYGACILQLLCGTWSVWVEGDVVELAETKP